MNLIIEKANLLDGLYIALKAVSNSSTMPILKCVLFNAFENGLQLTCNNLEMVIQTAMIDADVKQIGSVALEAKLLYEIAKALPDDYIHISVGDNYVTEIKSAKSKLSIIGSDPSEFPNIPKVKREHIFSIKNNILRDMIRQTIFALSDVSANPALTGELITLEDGKITVVALDGFRVAYRHGETDTHECSTEINVSGGSMRVIAKLLTDSDESLTNVYLVDSHILFELGTCTILSRLINGAYPDVNKLLNTDYSTSITINKADLLMGLERACLIAVERDKKIPVHMDINKEAVTISSNTERGSVREEIDAVIRGNELSIAFNPRYLIEALKAVEDSEVVVQYGGQYSPCVITPVEKDSYKYLVLPLRV